MEHKKENYDIREVLTEINSEFNCYSPLAIEIIAENLIGVQKLVEAGYNYNEIYDNGLSALLLAAFLDRREICEYFLGLNNINILHKDPNYANLIMYFSDNGYYSILPYVSKYIDINDKDAYGYNALFYAIDLISPKVDIIEVSKSFEIKNREKYNLIHSLFKNNDIVLKTLCTLVREGIDVNQLANGKTFLSHIITHYADNHGKCIEGATNKEIEETDFIIKFFLTLYPELNNIYIDRNNLLEYFLIEDRDSEDQTNLGPNPNIDKGHIKGLLSPYFFQNFWHIVEKNNLTVNGIKTVESDLKVIARTKTIKF